VTTIRANAAARIRETAFAGFQGRFTGLMSGFRREGAQGWSWRAAPAQGRILKARPTSIPASA